MYDNVVTWGTAGGLTAAAVISSALCMKMLTCGTAGGLTGAAVISSALCMIML